MRTSSQNLMKLVYRKKIILAVSSTLISVILCAGGYEAYQHIQYSRWRTNYAKRIETPGTITRPSDNPILLWEYRPNHKSRQGHSRYEVRTNQFGFRDKDYQTTDKPKGEYRVAFVGDSVTFGRGVDQDDTFVNQLALMLANGSPNPSINPMNFGIGGYNTIQIHELIKSKVLHVNRG